MNGFQVKVTRPDGTLYLISPSLPSWSAAQTWIAEHRRTAECNAPLAGSKRLDPDGIEGRR